MRSVLVFDTNIYVSTYIWGGKPGEAVRLARSGNFKLLYSQESIAELVRVLSLKKFGLYAIELPLIINEIKYFGENVNIISKEQPIKEDPSDNLFINLAIDGKAKIIVSGDKHLLKLKEYKGIKIITVSEFLKGSY